MTTPPEFTRVGSTLVATINDLQLRDAETVQRLKGEILSQLTDGLVQNVILDLAAVEFVGSIGFLAFLAIRRERTVDRILLCNLQPNVRELFSLCRLLAGISSPKAPFWEATSVSEALKQLES